MNHFTHVALAAFVGSLLVIACGSEEPDRAALDLSAFCPASVGSYWQYEETIVGDAAYLATIRHEYVGTESIESDYIDVAGVKLLVFESRWTWNGQDVLKRQYIEDSRDRLLRYRQIKWGQDEDPEVDAGNLHDYNPGLIRFDRTYNWVGATWSSQVTCYGGTCNDAGKLLFYEFEVLALDESVTVPAGTFECYKFQRENVDDQELKIYWYADGVGKVMEETYGLDSVEGATLEKTEVLTAYQVAAN